jgi:WD40 repeat protein
LNRFELNTIIEYPHGQQTSNQLLFHPNKFELITTGNDGFIKIWILIKQNQLTSIDKFYFKIKIFYFF